jgi:hypothetical protein
VEDPQWQPKDKDIIALVNLLLLEKIPLAGIVRAVGMSAMAAKLCEQILSKSRKESRSSTERKREADGTNGRVVVVCGQ